MHVLTIYVCKYTSVYVHMCLCMLLRMYVCMYVLCIYAYIFVGTSMMYA